MRENNVKVKLNKGETAFGISVGMPSPNMVEFVGLLGYDWVRIDCEHGPMDTETCERMVMAAENVGITSIIRLPYPDPHLIHRYLDTGALGILFGHCNSRERAEAMVAGAKFHPLGRRGAGSGARANDYGFRFPPPQYAEWANSETMLFGILEDKEALDALPEILKVKGLDGVCIGPSDLSQSMGLPGQTTHPEVLKLVEKMFGIVMASEKILQITLRGAKTALEDTQRYVDMGVPMIGINLRNVLIRGAQDLPQLKRARPGA